MFCTNCGRKLDESDRFCGGCGKPSRPEPAAAWSPRASRRLSRALDDKKIAGVCGGFARYLDVDVTLVRVVWLVLAICTGIGFVAYLVAWIAMPKDPPALAGPVMAQQAP